MSGKKLEVSPVEARFSLGVVESVLGGSDWWKKSEPRACRL